MLPILGALAVVAGLAVLGSRLSGALAGPDDGRGHRLVVSVLTGAVVLHLVLTLFQAVGLPWRSAVLVPALAFLAAVLHLAFRRAPRSRRPVAWGWGDAVALLALFVFAIVALSLWISTPDFVYHWGLKGERFHLAHGIDYRFLTESWNGILHPDYPNLLPELYAVTALAGRGFHAPAMMLWSVVWMALMLLAARETLVRGGTDRFTRQATVALVSLIVAAFGIGNLIAGGADGMIALALMAAVPALLATPSAVGDLQLGVVAAFAAAAKTEGVVLAALLIGAALLRHQPPPRSSTAAGEGATALPRAHFRGEVGILCRLLLPAAAVVLPWAWAVHRYGLFQQFNNGSFQWSRGAIVGPALLSSLDTGPWHGFSYALLLLPLLLLDRRLRLLAAIVALQLAFYLYIYFSANVDTLLLVQASFARLLLHLVPAVLVGAAIARQTLQTLQTLQKERGRERAEADPDGERALPGASSAQLD